MNTNISDLDILMAVCREERDQLPKGKLTTGESIHALILEVLGQTVLKAQKKKLEIL